MAIINVAEQGPADQTRGKQGRATHYGRRRYGYFEYGQQPPILGPGQYGVKAYGKTRYGNFWSPWGIYQVRSELGEQKNIKEVFYIPANPQTPAQQNNRTVFANAVAEWKALTEDEKEVYNKKAEGKPLSGYNLFIRKYMLS